MTDKRIISSDKQSFLWNLSGVQIMEDFHASTWVWKIFSLPPFPTQILPMLLWDGEHALQSSTIPPIFLPDPTLIFLDENVALYVCANNSIVCSTWPKTSQLTPICTGNRTKSIEVYYSTTAKKHQRISIYIYIYTLISPGGYSLSDIACQIKLVTTNMSMYIELCWRE